MNRKKVLGIVSSYRKLGNCEIIVKAVARRMGDDWDLSLIRLPALKIYPCKGCYACLIPGKECNLKDDMQWFIERLMEADAVIFASPNYTLAPAGIVKMISDRTIQAFPFYKELKKKRTAVVLTLGKEDYRGYADTALASQAGTTGLDVVVLRSFIGTHPGESALAPDFQQKIDEMAAALSSDDYEESVGPNRCPRCFSDIFRIRPGGIECAVCKSMANYTDGSLDFFYFHPEFTEEGRMEHMKWLLRKKEEYPRLKDRLKEIQDNYREGEWLSPEE